jgi:hypothetical protein
MPAFTFAGTLTWLLHTQNAHSHFAVLNSQSPFSTPTLLVATHSMFAAVAKVHSGQLKGEPCHYLTRMAGAHRKVGTQS